MSTSARLKARKRVVNIVVEFILDLIFFLEERRGGGSYCACLFLCIVYRSENDAGHILGPFSANLMYFFIVSLQLISVAMSKDYTESCSVIIT